MRKTCLVIILALFIVATLAVSISIGSESSTKDEKANMKISEESTEEINDKKIENEKQDLSEESKEGKEEEEKKPAWKIAGWQAIFALIAVGYYILVLKFLPFIVEKKNAGGHH